MNNDLRVKVASQITTPGQDDGAWQYALQTADELITLILDEVNNRLAEIKKHAKETYGLDESVGVDMSINAVNNLRGRK